MLDLLSGLPSLLVYIWLLGWLLFRIYRQTRYKPRAIDISLQLGFLTISILRFIGYATLFHLSSVQRSPSAIRFEMRFESASACTMAIMSLAFFATDAPMF